MGSPIDFTTAFAKISSGQYDDKGRFCFYIKIDEKYGLKTYTQESMRNATFDMQQTVFKLGLAPEVFEKFQIDMPNGSKVFGYVTEHCETLRDRFRKMRQEKDLNLFTPNIDYDFRTKMLETQDALVNQGWYDPDAHLGNYGIRANGDVVCLDVGEIRKYP